MRRSLVVSCVAAGALVSSVAFAARPIRVPICHLDAGVFALIQVIQAAVPAHLARHGDVYPGSWWPDADGDGYGDPGAEPSACPQTGLVANDDDCDEGTSSVSPGAEEVCADGIDQDCDGEVDDGCAPSCPCFTRELITQHFQARRLYANEFVECAVSDFEWVTETYYDRTFYAKLVFGSTETSGTSEWIEEDWFESSSHTSYVLPGGTSYAHDALCLGRSGGHTHVGATTHENWEDYSSYGEFLTEQQDAACQALLVATAAELGVVCETF